MASGSCLILTIACPAAILYIYNVGAHVLPQFIGTHGSASILLLSVYGIQSIVLALFSIITGAKIGWSSPVRSSLRNGIFWPLRARTSRILLLWMLIDRPIDRLILRSSLGWLGITWLAHYRSWRSGTPASSPRSM